MSELVEIAIGLQHEVFKVPFANAQDVKRDQVLQSTIWGRA
jgi:hypothetical protein